MTRHLEVQISTDGTSYMWVTGEKVSLLDQKTNVFFESNTNNYSFQHAS